jgi:homospermidine synthase
MIDFPKRVLFLGFGAVAQCTLPIFLRHLRVPPTQITVMDFEELSKEMEPYTCQGMNWVQHRVTPENLGETLGKYLSEGDLLIDLAWNIECREIVQWCRDHGVLYINTSVEVWDPYTGACDKHPTEKTLYRRHMDVRRMKDGWKTPGPTAILEHGANPGLISHFTKRALLDIAERVVAERRVSPQDADEIRQLAADRVYNHLAMRLGVKVIHCSERDTQISAKPKQVGEFVNTWSVEGFHEEGTTTAEMGWGTHEKQLPPRAHEHSHGPRNQICLARMGINTWVRSWVPNYTIRGMVIRHGEAFTISDRLTVREGDRAVYRPTVHYAYCPCDSAIASLNELRGNDYEFQSRIRILRDEIVDGADVLGALVMGHAFNSWWTGTDLNIHRCRELLPHQNATTMQVAIAVVAAVMWMIQNPDRGLLSPEDVPHEYILDVAKPYLGNYISQPSDWTPLAHYQNAFPGHFHPKLDPEDPWQFCNFYVDDRD